MQIVQPIIGIVFFIMLTSLLSEQRDRIPWRIVAGAILLQVILLITLTKIPLISDGLFVFSHIVQGLESATKAGASFIFGYLGGGPVPFEMQSPQHNFIIAFQILPIIIVVSAISSLLFHWGILQKIILGFSWLLRKTLNTDGATGLGVASSIFLGIIESPIFVKPYLKTMSRSGLFSLITAGMATVAGTVMVLYSSILSGVIENAAGQILIASIISAPAAIMISQMIIPPDQKLINNINNVDVTLKSDKASAFEAIIDGTNEGVSMVIGIIGILLVLFAFIAIINNSLGLLPFNEPITIQKIAGYLFYPFMWLMGIESTDLLQAGQLMGTKLMLNEFVAYSQMAGAPLSNPKSNVIMTYAMCGFANFGSLGILIGGLGTIVPERKNEIVSLSLKAIMAGTIATMLTGTIAGIIL